MFSPENEEYEFLEKFETTVECTQDSTEDSWPMPDTSNDYQKGAEENFLACDGFEEQPA